MWITTYFDARPACPEQASTKTPARGWDTATIGAVRHAQIRPKPERLSAIEGGK